MRYPARSSQKGISLLALIVMGAVAVAIFTIGSQSLPIISENQAIIRAVDKAASSGGSIPEIRAAFDRAAAIDNINTITGKDLKVTQAGSRTVVSVEYESSIPLVGPAYLVYRFNHQSK